MSERSNLTKIYLAQGYARVRNVIPAEVAAVFLSMTQAAMGRTREEQARFAQSPNPLNIPAYDIYSPDYPAAATFQWGLTPFMERATGKSLLPTYCYFRAYPQGAVCKIHADRFACEHSMSLALGTSDGIAWPFAIGKRRLIDRELPYTATQLDFAGEAYSEFELNPGDGILYQGPFHLHGRLPPNPNRWSAHIFLHWIDRNGPYKDHAFDKRTLPPPADFLF